MTTSIDSQSIETRHARCCDALEARGQIHVFDWWDDLDRGQRQHLLREIESIPWSHLDPLIETHVLNKPEPVCLTGLEPPRILSHVPDEAREPQWRDARELGETLIREGKVAAFTVAGGQGTRLGFDGPKGAVTISPVRDKTLFQLFAETIRAVRKRYDVPIPWYIMTNPADHNQTGGLFNDHEYYGLPADDVKLFPQAMLPTFDFDGRMLMANKFRLALSPDGHGGSLKALVSSGALQDMQDRGVEIISYFQVDNPLVKPFDPLFLGLHVQTGSEMSAKVAPKTDDLERVGNVCVHDGRTTVIEYSNFPEELARARNGDGTRRFNAGNLGIHLLDVSFVDRVIGQRFELPYNRAEKIVTWLDANGFRRTPKEPNGVKLETFVFDALPLAENPLVFEVDRREEFSPVKNARGVDSVESAIRDQIHRAARWLEAANVIIPRNGDGQPDVTIEISPAYALSSDDVKARVRRPPTLEPGETIYIS